MKNFRLILFTFIFLISSCSDDELRENASTSPIIKGNCTCTNEYAPVCTTIDNQTFSNSCRAECQGYSDYKFGECELVTETKDCGCLEGLEDPICATDGKTYTNLCDLTCQSAVYNYKGECSASAQNDTLCTTNFSPSCGEFESGAMATFSNQCFLEAAGAQLLYEGACLID